MCETFVEMVADERLKGKSSKLLIKVVLLKNKIFETEELSQWTNMSQYTLYEHQMNVLGFSGFAFVLSKKNTLNQTKIFEKYAKTYLCHESKYAPESWTELQTSIYRALSCLWFIILETIFSHIWTHFHRFNQSLGAYGKWNKTRRFSVQI